MNGQVAAQQDSLHYYLETAARNNPLLKADFLAYQAALQKIPQAGAYPDPQFDAGVFVPSMEIIDGKQVANFTLMQMFPWFGTRKAARNEATEMAVMAYEKFRETRDNLFFEVKSQWYILCNLKQRLNNVRENRELLSLLEELAIGKFTAGGNRNSASVSRSTATPSAETASATGGMQGMATSSGSVAAAPVASQSMSGMSDSGSSMSGASFGMSDVLRIQLETVELDSRVESLESEIRAETVKFNTLLNRLPETPVTLPDSLLRVKFSPDERYDLESIRERSPMLGMLSAETDAFRAKAEMDRRMGYPMFGFGLQYMLIGRRMDMGIPVTAMNGKDMVMPMFSLTLPIYRKKYTAREAESRLMIRSGEERYANTLNELDAEYARTRHRLSEALRKVELYEKQSALARTTYELIVREFSAGVSDLTNVIQVHRQLLDYQLKRSEAIADYNTTVASYRRLLSGVQEESRMSLVNGRRFPTYD